MAATLLLLAAWISVPTAAFAYESEPNDTMATANEIYWGTNYDHEQHQIGEAGDIDWYRFEAETTGVWTAQLLDVSLDLASGLTLRAFDASGREVGREIAGTWNVLTAVEVPVETAGNVYFSVTGADATEVGGYTIEVWPQYGGGNVWGPKGEPDGSPKRSQPLPVGLQWRPVFGSTYSDVHSSPDVDVYHVIGGDSDASYEARFISRQTPLRVRVLDQDEREVQVVTCAVWEVCRLDLVVPAGEPAYVALGPTVPDNGVVGACVLPAGQAWCDDALVQRIAGSDRYATAAALTRADHPSTPIAVYVASGEIFTDALSGAAAASAHGGVVMLVRKDSIPSVIAAELRRLKAPRIVVLGGPATISPGVERALSSFGATSVERWSGKDRYATSAAISAHQFRAGVDTAYIASGDVFADGLAAGPAPEESEGPVLLVARDRIPAAVAAELTRLKPERIVVVGGPATIGPELETDLARYTTGPIERWAGKDRYATSAAVSAGQFSTAQNLMVTTGETYADALAAAPSARWRQGPVLLVTKDRIPSSVAAELRRLGPRTITILGGTNSVSDAVRRDLEGYAAP